MWLILPFPASRLSPRRNRCECSACRGIPLACSRPDTLSPCGGPGPGLVSCWTRVTATQRTTLVGTTGMWVGHADGSGPHGRKAFSFDSAQAATSTSGDPAGLRLTQAITLDAWIDPSHGLGRPSGHHHEVGRRQPTRRLRAVRGWRPMALLSCSLSDRSDRRLRGNQCGLGGGSVAVNAWTNVGLTCNDSSSATLSIYLNGVQIASTLLSGGITGSNVPVQIGHQDNADGRYFAGRVADVSVYKRALSASEMRIFNAHVGIDS